MRRSLRQFGLEIGRSAHSNSEASQKLASVFFDQQLQDVLRLPQDAQPLGSIWEEQRSETLHIGRMGRKLGLKENGARPSSKHRKVAGVRYFRLLKVISLFKQCSIQCEITQLKRQFTNHNFFKNISIREMI